jgi:6,7-dimethyl-8-ribityllumazine synthase
MKKTYETKAEISIPNSRIAILQGRWHEEHTDLMADACVKLLSEAGCEKIDRFKVPGCYEIPLAAKKLAKLERYDAIVTFGAIVKGDTDHYQVLLDTCIRELGRVMYDFEIPIIMEVLPVFKLEDLIARTKGENNKGLEAGHAAIEAIVWHRDLEAGRLAPGHMAPGFGRRA